MHVDACLKRLFFVLFISISLTITSFSHQGNKDQRAYKFIENKGQWHKDHHFIADLPEGKMYLNPKYIGFIFRDQQAYNALRNQTHPGTGSHTAPPANNIYNEHAIKLSFQGANPNTNIVGISPFSEKRNYFLGNDSSRWASDVLSYEQIKYENLYSGIDLIIDKKKGFYKYAYYIDPKIDYSQIRIEIDGAEDIFLEDGHLVVKTSVNEIVDAPPIAYQIINDVRIDIPCRYKLENGVVSFELLKKPRRNYPLVIDPKLIFSTSSGSTADNWGNTACLDRNGNLFTGGTVFSGSRTSGGTPEPSGFPTTPGAFQSVFQGGNTDIGILKFDSSGTNLLYATYLGGSDTDVPTSTIVNNANQLLILAVTGSNDFPGALNTYSGGPNVNPSTGYTFPNGSDILVIKLSALGNAILAARYVGGTALDGITLANASVTNNYGDQFRGEINLDGGDNVYVASTTSSPDFPVGNSFDTSYNGGAYDAVVFKMPPNLDSLEWGAFVGGASTDAGFAIQLDNTDQIFMAGGTDSPNFPASSLDTVINGNVDGYVVRINNNGDSITAGTYVGTPNFDQTYFVQVDLAGGVYLFGQTRGDFLRTPSTYFDTLSGHFIQKLNNDLDLIEFSFPFGQSFPNATSITSNISPTAFLVNDCENIFVSGWGGSINGSGTGVTYGNALAVNMPITPDAYKPVSDGNDFYLGAFRQGGTQLIYGTYFGGGVSRDHVDGGTSRFDRRGIVYQSVCSGCGGNQDWPTFPDDNSQATYPMRNESDNCNNGVFKFDLAFLEANFDFEQDNCLDKTIQFNNNSLGGINYTWKFGDGDTLFIETQDSVVHTYQQGGVYEVTLIAVDFATCIGVDSVKQTIVVLDSVIAPADTGVCPGEPIILVAESATRTDRIVWDAHPSLSCTSCQLTLANPSAPTTYTVRVSANDTCEHSDEVFIDIYPDDITVDFSIDKPCLEREVTLQNTSSDAEDFFWVFGDGGSISTEDEFVTYTYDSIGAYNITLSASSIHGCGPNQFSTQSIVIIDTIEAFQDTLMCKGESASLEVVGHWDPIWDNIPGLDCYNCMTPFASPYEPTHYIVRAIAPDGCESSDTVFIDLIPEEKAVNEISIEVPRCYTEPVRFAGGVEGNDCECCKSVNSWTWFFGDGKSTDGQVVFHEYPGPGDYQAILQTITKDTLLDTITFTLLPSDSCLKNIYIPNAFSPNEDGENDILYVRGVNIIKLDFHLYDRIGEEVFTTTSLNKGWNGEFKNRRMSQQVFVYTCNATFWDGTTVTKEGNITLLE